MPPHTILAVSNSCLREVDNHQHESRDLRRENKELKDQIAALRKELERLKSA